MSGNLTQAKGAAPSTPASGYTTTYPTTDGRTHILDSTGIDNVLNSRDLYNYIRNSAFWFAQRQTPGSVGTYSTPTGRAISADGWGITNENASATYRRIDTIAAPEAGLRSRYWGEFVKITSLGKLAVTQVIEGVTGAPLRGRNVRVTVLMKGIVGTPTIRLGLIQLSSAGTVDAIPATYISAFGAGGTDPTLGTNLAYIAPTAGKTGDNCTANGNAFDCVTTGAWQRFSGVFTVPSTAKNLIVSVWSNAGLTATNGIGISEVSLVDGEEIQDASPQSLQEELDRVQRFYVKTFPIDTAPAASAGVTTGALQAIIGKAVATALAGQAQWRYPVRLRAAATTLTLYNPGAAGAQARRVSGAAAADQTATVTANSTEQSVDVTWTGDASGAVGDRAIVHVSADAEL